jgi:hypothetical protein
LANGKSRLVANANLARKFKGVKLIMQAGGGDVKLFYRLNQRIRNVNTWKRQIQSGKGANNRLLKALNQVQLFVSYISRIPLNA